MRLALTGLETVINATLRLDLETLTQLAKLQGKTVLIEITDWQLTFYVTLHSNGVSLTTTDKDKPDTTIRGELNALFRLGFAKNKSAALFKNKIEVEGDLAVAEQLRDIFKQLDIDWEEQLSNIIGDISAYKISELAGHFKQFTRQACNTLASNVTEFLQLEVRALPTAGEVQQFANDVSAIRNDVDRAEARITRLTQSKKRG